MKNLSIMLLSILISASLWAIDSPKRLLSYELVASYSQEMLKEKWKEEGIPEIIVPVNYTIDVYEVIYSTSWHDGSVIKASGLYFVPKTKETALPMICYHHGTQIKKNRKVKLGGEQAICIGFAADGYLVARPDYIGLGKGEKTHLYQHTASEAIATIDMLRAIKELNKAEGIMQNDKLFSTGYSQGGHAAMAFHKVVQENHKDEFSITASAPMSGAYDMTGAQEQAMFTEYSHPGYLPYLMYSMQEVYGLYDNINSIFKSPYDSILAPLYDGKHTMNEINKVMPKVPKDIVKDEIVEEYKKDEDFPFKKALAANNVNDWKAESPVLLCYCKADEQVYYGNSLSAHKHMKAQGSKRIKLKSAGKHFDHNTCALFASMHTKMWFDSFCKGHKRGNLGPVFKRFLLGIGKSRLTKKMKKKKKVAAKQAKEDALQAAK